MSVRTGLLAVAALFVVYAALYWHYVIVAAMPLDAQISYFVGSCAAICMALGLLLSARPRRAESSFGGLDRMYKLHKYLGVVTLLLFIAHYATVPGGPEGEVAAAGCRLRRSQCGAFRIGRTRGRTGRRRAADRPVRPDRDDRFHAADRHHAEPQDSLPPLDRDASIHGALLHRGRRPCLHGALRRRRHPAPICSRRISRAPAGGGTRVLCLQAADLSEQAETPLRRGCRQQARACDRSGAATEEPDVFLRAGAVSPSSPSMPPASGKRIPSPSRPAQGRMCCASR